jgi:hypothetical protein
MLKLIDNEVIVAPHHEGETVLAMYSPGNNGTKRMSQLGQRGPTGGPRVTSGKRPFVTRTAKL